MTPIVILRSHGRKRKPESEFQAAIIQYLRVRFEDCEGEDCEGCWNPEQDDFDPWFDALEEEGAARN